MKPAPNHDLSAKPSPRRICVAPMLDWTDRHYRFFLRQISRHAFLYTEMVTTGAIIHGERSRFLDFSECEHPVALQLGGSEPADLTQCAKLAEQWGYDEVNINVGCPSERVQSGAFGACLMEEPQLVADCIKAMRDVVSIPVTVKHRIGINEVEHYEYLRDFVGTVAEAGCEVFIAHARNAILKGLSPKENREIPPLKYDYVHRLKRDFPQLEIIINGGIDSWDTVDEQLQQVDGVMIGRMAYHDPYQFAQVDARYYGDDRPIASRAEVARLLMPYIAERMQGGRTLPKHIVRHILGLYQGKPGARNWRRLLSDSKQLQSASPSIIQSALAEVEPALVA
ncbi:tRNA dihydrouridine(20/20a) synthase DusA [Chitinimonas sp. BJB300]|uniref:tRNA dihydrouridine(20/20a) synthase DusA n=1 Tax=Chitinimonas sp. BJB300 TaxID=1559339 RepID=UPI000C0DED90|nr:tRNA dihydrouridine(20/20a) synthase DusA [Chitinimonas sp. BJB300]PHV12017.1 tRNA dihydrouridine(20/20a) synthase DusA [Chitinimonas sp. BJB300]TSJ91460.1 tRNA dihydrouridine(20/20a) synthase DusA [Chitinimonas sp. BJB300]